MYHDFTGLPEGQAPSWKHDPVKPVQMPLMKCPVGMLALRTSGNTPSSAICKLDQTSILYGETSDPLEFTSKGTSSTVSFIFALNGCLDIVDIKKRRAQSVVAGTATSVIDHPDMKIEPQAGSAWLTYRVPVTILREHFERMSHLPFFDTFDFAPLYNFREGGASALYDAVCHVSENMSGIANSCVRSLRVSMINC